MRITAFLRRLALCVLVTALAMARVGAADSARLPVRVVVVTTFELGNDTGDTPGEFQAWVERVPLPQTLPFALGNHALRYNPQQQVLGIVTGEGSLRAAASIMALGLDQRFELSKAYWLVPAIARHRSHLRLGGLGRLGRVDHRSGPEFRDRCARDPT